MTLPSLVQIEERVRELAARIGAAGSALPTFGRSEDGARPHVEVDASGLQFVVVERGEELKRITTRDLDELLWHVFANVTFSLACDYGAKHRVNGQDFRRTMFAKQVELLAKLSLAWAKREAMNHDEILKRHPFDDV